MEWRQINAYGIRIGYRTYDCPELGPWRLQHLGVTARRGLWEVHYDPYDVTKVFVRTPDGWTTVPWTHLPVVSAPFAEFTWRHARKLTAERGWTTATRPRSPACSTRCSPARRPAPWTGPPTGSLPAPASRHA